MKYLNAQKVLPDGLLKAVQTYIEGETLYIPRKESGRRPWGDKSGYKQYLNKRNAEIFRRYAAGETVEALAEAFFLSEPSIRRILAKQKRLG